MTPQELFDKLNTIEPLNRRMSKIYFAIEDLNCEMYYWSCADMFKCRRIRDWDAELHSEPIRAIQDLITRNHLEEVSVNDVIIQS